MSGARVREARRAKSWERAERSEESAERTTLRAERRALRVVRVRQCAALHHVLRKLRESLRERWSTPWMTEIHERAVLCATTLSSLDAAVVTRRRRRMTSFAFPSGGARHRARLYTSDAICDDGGQAPSTQTAPTAPTARTAARACRGRRPRWQGLHRNSLARLRRRLRRRRPRLGVPTG